MTYNDQQFAQLAAFEEYFETAVNHRYARNLPHGAPAEIAEIHRAATGSRLKANNCAQCQLRLLRVVGTHYFADKEEREAAAAAAAKRVAETEEIPAPKKATVKTETTAKAAKQTSPKKPAQAAKKTTKSEK